ncbi:MAG TPA: glycosyltransferase family 4 protein [Thermoanaerobaculia bacterium]|nr:glycosyltransferase family 4 protein [Thermoanaerobaculia bacterium]
MRILSVLTYYSPHWTGLTRHAVRVAEDLARRGHEVTVLSTRHTPDLPPHETQGGVRIVRVEPVSRFSRGMFAPMFPLAALRLMARTDVVQIHSPLPEAPLVAFFGRLLDKPVVLTHHADVVMPAGLANRFVEHAALAVLTSAARLASAVTSYSRDYADHSPFLSAFEDRLTCIAPPVRLPEPDRIAARAWRDSFAPHTRNLLGFAGRWVEEKGFDVLLRAFPLVLRELPDAHLVYAGESGVVYENSFDRCRPLLEPLRDHVTFLGLLRDPALMANFYALCDLFVLPSRSDMMALVQVEAMLAGTPVVASDIPGARIVVERTGFGRLAPPEDPEGLARVLVETLRDRERFRPEPGAVAAVFNPQTSIDDYEALFHRVLGDAR